MDLRDSSPLTSILELGVAEAYHVLTTHFKLKGLPPLDAIENEDWGRDFLLSQFLEFSQEKLTGAGLTWDEPQLGNVS